MNEAHEHISAEVAAAYAADPESFDETQVVCWDQCPVCCQILNCAIQEWHKLPENAEIEHGLTLWGKEERRRRAEGLPETG